VSPSNEGRGYVLRRIMRRAMRHAHILGAREPLMHRLAPTLIAEMGEAYPELKRAGPVIEAQLREEEERFRRTLANGLRLLEDEIGGLTRPETLRPHRVQALRHVRLPARLHAGYFARALARSGRRGIRSRDAGAEGSGRRELEGRDGGDNPAIWHSILERTRGNEFLGYGAEEGEGRLAGVVAGGAEQHELREGVQAALVFDRTPFYAESGGQAGDKGVIRFANGAEFLVEDTQKQAGALHAHIGRLSKGA
jgi:alanyl-tRNA synthetase